VPGAGLVKPWAAGVRPARENRMNLVGGTEKRFHPTWRPGMNRLPTTLDLAIKAALKLDSVSGERQNVLSFILSCYGGRVRTYDFDAALASLDKLTDEEEQALIVWSVRVGSGSVRTR
jgi:hypothetical protein